MKYPIVPDPIQLRDPVTKEPFQKPDPDNPRNSDGTPNLIDEPPVSFKDWFIKFVLSDKKFNVGMETWIKATKLLKAVEALEALEGEGLKALALEDEDWKLAADVAKKPSGMIYGSTFVAIQLVPFVIALAGTEDKPVSSKPPEDIEIAEAA